MDGLDVRASAEAGQRLFALRGLSAKGKGASVKAVYLMSGQEKRGAALLAVGPLAVAVGVGKGGPSVHLLGPGGWFAHEQERLQPGTRLAVLPRVPAKQ